MTTHPAATRELRLARRLMNFISTTRFMFDRERMTAQRVFIGICVLLFALSAAATILWCTSMQAKAGMPMPGGWTMSMAWMRMCGQTWPGVAASFIGMWSVMTVAMMLPALVPMLMRYRGAIGGIGESRRTWLTITVAVAYFVVWIAAGVAVFPFGVALASIDMQLPMLARAVPLAVGTIVAIAGALQFSAWKARRLACCRASPQRGRMLPASVAIAWRHGVTLGIHCVACCANLSAMLFVLGVMDLRVMALVTAAIGIERLAPRGKFAARMVGVVIAGTGLWLIACAATRF